MYALPIIITVTNVRLQGIFGLEVDYDFDVYMTDQINVNTLAATTEQDTLGRTNYLRGRHSKEWENAQHAYLESKGKTREG